MERLSQGCVLGVGQPLLDYLANVGDETYVKYELKKDDAILVDAKHATLYEEILRKCCVRYEAGGASLNTIRMIQWLLKKPHVCSFIGCVGLDDAAEILRRECEKVGLRVKFYPAKNGGQTGKCAVLIQDKCRSMVTQLGASRELTLDQLKSNESWSMVERARLFYLTGYMLNSCPDSVEEVAKHAHAHGKLLCFNFGAPYILTYLTESVDAILPYVDIIFCNREEAKAYAAKHKLQGQPMANIAQHLASLPRLTGYRNHRIVLITQETDPVIVAVSGDPVVRRYPVPEIPSEDIVDTNGAGDAFAAGFLADYLSTMFIESSVKAGLKAAQYIIQKSGFSLGPREQYN